jgi:hypothetical protein
MGRSTASSLRAPVMARIEAFDPTNLPIKAIFQIAYGFDAPVIGAPD